MGLENVLGGFEQVRDDRDWVSKTSIRSTEEIRHVDLSIDLLGVVSLRWVSLGISLGRISFGISSLRRFSLGRVNFGRLGFGRISLGGFSLWRVGFGWLSLGRTARDRPSWHLERALSRGQEATSRDLPSGMCAELIPMQIASPLLILFDRHY